MPTSTSMAQGEFKGEFHEYVSNSRGMLDRLFKGRVYVLPEGSGEVSPES